MIKILHTGDFHLGATYSSFKDSEKVKNFLLKAIKNMINTANSLQVDAILIAGDTFDSQDVDFNLRMEFIKILSKFNGKIFIVLGNHDYYFMSSVWSNIELFENMILFTENTFKAYKFSDEVTIYGASFTNIYDNIELPTVDNTKINIGLVHSDILTNSHYNSYSQEQIAQSKFNYLAFGHNHRFSEILCENGVFYSATGNISATGFDEIGIKGYVVAEISKDSSKFEFVPSEGLYVLSSEIDVSKFLNIEQLYEEILKISGQNIYYKLRFFGINNLNINFQSLDFSEHFFGYDIEDETKDIDSLWKYLGDDSLLGEFSRILSDEYEKTGDHNVLIALDLGISALL